MFAMTMDGKGNLFGATQQGGISLCCHGVAFELSKTKTGHTERVLHAFCSRGDGQYFCPDGDEPTGPLVQDADGNLFGTADGGNENYDGVVFKIVPRPVDPKESVLHTFCDEPSGSQCPKGALPVGGLAIDAGGNLYGTTQIGGSYAADTAGGGTVFEFAGKREKVLYRFCRIADCRTGKQPWYTQLALGPSGNIYGTTSEAGRHGYGTVFKLTPTRSAE